MRIIKHPFRVGRCLWKQLHLHWTTLNRCFFKNDCWFALYTFLTHYRRLLVWNEHYSALLVTVHGRCFQQRFYSKFWRCKWGQRNKKGPFLFLNICEYFWPRESFGNSLNAEIKRSRRQQSLIFQWQSQHQSEKWRRYRRDPYQSDQPPHPGSRSVFWVAMVTHSPSSPVHIWSLHTSWGMKTVLAFGENSARSGVPLWGVS